MKKKRSLDLLIAAISLAIAALLYFYMDYGANRHLLAGVLTGIAVLFLILAVLPQKRGELPEALQIVPPTGTPSELILLGEEDTELATWDLYGKAGLVIGRDVGENHVDVSLQNSTFASMVDVEHAVLNYTGGCWQVEDLGSKNGISVQKFVDKRKYKLAADKPCRLEKGDVIFVGLARLVIR